MAQPRKQRPYKRRRTTKTSRPYARISNGGVGGAAQQMVPRPMPPPQEVKTFDIDVNGTATGSGFTPMGSANVSIGACFLAGITPGANPNQRVGRQIRVVGVCLRGVLSSQGSSAFDSGLASCIDMVWDKQANGIAVPTNITAVVYDETAGSSIINLPNANFVKRFSFIKRIQDSRATIPTARRIIDATIKTSRLVNYDAATANATSVEQNSLLLFIASLQAGSTFVGTLRIMFVDA